MELEWVEDPKRIGRCWDLRYTNGLLRGFVIKHEGEAGWRTACYGTNRLFDTKEEAMAMQLAFVRMGA